MRRRTFLKTTGGAAWIAAAGCTSTRVRGTPGAGRSALPDTSKMNVLLIDIEDMTAEAVGCYGNPIPKTPVLDRFAKGATRFARTYCQAPMCNPSRTSFLTGLRPDSTGVLFNPDPMHQRLPQSVLSLPELLKAKGIYSVNIGKLFHQMRMAEKQYAAFDRLEFCGRPPGWKGLSTGYPKHLKEAEANLPKPKFRFSADPDEEKRLSELSRKRAQIYKTAKPGSREYNRARSMFQQPMANVVGDSGRHEEQEHDGRKARMAASILKELARTGNQFFLSVGFSRPHTPLVCPKTYLDLYDFDTIPAPAAPPEKDRGIPAVAKRFGRNYDIFNGAYRKPVTAEAARRAVHAYYACASFVDAQVGLVLDALDRTGLARRTIVVILSDHGFNLGEHGCWSKYALFEQSTRVPLLVRVPGLADGGAVCDGITELVDLVPTLCDLLGLSTPANLEGTSLVPLLARPDRPWKKAAFTILKLGATATGRSARTKRYRYAEWMLKDGTVEKELYDLASDRWEQTNLAGDARHAARCQEMAALLKAGWKAARPSA